MAPKKPAAKSAKAKGKAPARASASTAKKTTQPASKVTKSAPAKKKTAVAKPTATPSAPKTKKVTSASRKAAPFTNDERIFKDGPFSELYYDDHQPLDDIIQEIGKRSLTKVDKELIIGIHELEAGEDHEFAAMVKDLHARERYDYTDGKPFNCHFKLYMRFMDRYRTGSTTVVTGNRATRPGRSASPGVLPSVEAPAASKRGSKASTGSGARSSSRPVSPSKPVSPNKATSPAKATSPTKAGGRAQSVPPRGKSPSPTKANAAVGWSVNKSPAKSTAPSKRMSPIRASAGIEKPTSRNSPNKTTTTARARSASPAKNLPMTRPLRGPGSTSPKKIPLAESERRFNRNDDYGDIMRNVEQHQYATARFGAFSEQAIRSLDDPSEPEYLSPDDLAYVVARGNRRAEEKRRAEEEGGEEEEEEEEEETIDEVDHNGVVLNQRVAGRARGSQGRVITRPSPSPSPRKNTSPAKASSSAARGVSATSLRHSPSKALPALPAGEPSKEGHGPIRSTLNPEFFETKGKPSKKNPFFETMPQPETWHRNMPGFLSIGETPYMERVVSNQISEDLGRTHEDVQAEPPQKKNSLVGTISNLFGVGGSTSSGKAKEPASPSKKDVVVETADKILTMWDLPKLDVEE